jgi:type I restriction enzyme M protein
MTAHQLVSKLWNYCNILRDDGLSYGDYVEQLTFLLFLKMTHEPAHARSSAPGRGIHHSFLVRRMLLIESKE